MYLEYTNIHIKDLTIIKLESYSIKNVCSCIDNAFNTEIINSYTIKNSSGVQILKLKDRIIANCLKLNRDIQNEDQVYYKRNHTAIGYYLNLGDLFF